LVFRLLVDSQIAAGDVFRMMGLASS
jgi:hypothetical protein